MITTKLIEVNGNEFNETDRAFLKQHYRAMSREEHLFLMDGTNFAEKLDEAKTAGCSPDFVKAYQEALDKGGELVLFYFDV